MRKNRANMNSVKYAATASFPSLNDRITNRVVRASNQGSCRNHTIVSHRQSYCINRQTGRKQTQERP